MICELGEISKQIAWSPVVVDKVQHRCFLLKHVQSSKPRLNNGLILKENPDGEHLWDDPGILPPHPLHEPTLLHLGSHIKLQSIMKVVITGGLVVATWPRWPVLNTC